MQTHIVQVRKSNTRFWNQRTQIISLTSSFSDFVVPTSTAGKCTWKHEHISILFPIYTTSDNTFSAFLNPDSTYPHYTTTPTKDLDGESQTSSYKRGMVVATFNTPPGKSGSRPATPIDLIQDLSEGKRSMFKVCIPYLSHIAPIVFPSLILSNTYENILSLHFEKAYREPATQKWIAWNVKFIRLPWLEKSNRWC